MNSSFFNVYTDAFFVTTLRLEYIQILRDLCQDNCGILTCANRQAVFSAFERFESGRFVLPAPSHMCSVLIQRGNLY